VDKLINKINEALDLVHRIEAHGEGDVVRPWQGLEAEENRIHIATLHCQLATVLAEASIESLKLVKHA